MHTDTPVLHEVTPSLQASLAVHALPAAHEPQTPRLHTLSVPQLVPLGSASPLSVHPRVGEQVEVPPWQGFPGTHARPSVQVTHAPPLHNLPVPHGVPFGALADSMQIGVPVSQTVVPVRQGLPATAQIAPDMQGMQAPSAPQTLSLPHGVPGGEVFPVSLQSDAVAVQLSVPVWQAVGGAQVAPSAHGTHAPFWHTTPDPHEAPFGRLSVSVQTAFPLEQSTVPVRHGLSVSAQNDAAAQLVQVASLQTEAWSQGLPLAFVFCVSRQVAVVPVQTTSPS